MRGFTLLGIILTISVSTLVSLASYRAFRSLSGSFLSQQAVLEGTEEAEIVLHQMSNWVAQRKDASTASGLPIGSNYSLTCGSTPYFSTLTVYRLAENGMGLSQTESIVFATRCIPAARANIQAQTLCQTSFCPVNCPAGTVPRVEVTESLANPTTMVLQSSVMLHPQTNTSASEHPLGLAFCYVPFSNSFRAEFDVEYLGAGTTPPVYIHALGKDIVLDAFTFGNTQPVYRYP